MSMQLNSRAIFLVSLALAGIVLAVGCDGDTPGAPAPSPPPPAASPTATLSVTPSGMPSASPVVTTEPVQPEGTPGGNPDGEPTAEDAVDVVDAYFAAINDRDYETAYALWRNEGEASGQTFEEFAAGFTETVSVTWEMGDPGRIDPGAGQRYIPIPVTLTATMTAGETQRFEGTYVLHHTADIEGATAEQRVWRIHSADIEQVE